VLVREIAAVKRLSHGQPALGAHAEAAEHVPVNAGMAPLPGKAAPRPRPARAMAAAAAGGADGTVPAPESVDDCITVSQKQAYIKKMMKVAWDGYHDHAWVCVSLPHCLSYPTRNSTATPLHCLDLSHTGMVTTNGICLTFSAGFPFFPPGLQRTRPSERHVSSQHAVWIEFGRHHHRRTRHVVSHGHDRRACRCKGMGACAPSYATWPCSPCGGFPAWLPPAERHLWWCGERCCSRCPCLEYTVFPTSIRYR
jgi:hypothetical protein